MPRVVVLAGINEAGKPTASREILVNVLEIPVFTNADAEKCGRRRRREHAGGESVGTRGSGLTPR